MPLGDCPQCHVLFRLDVEFSADTVVRPDLVVICREPEGDWVTRAPEMIVEVVSMNSARRDESIKFDLYEAEGVAYYLRVSLWGSDWQRSDARPRFLTRVRVASRNSSGFPGTGTAGKK